MNAGTCLCGEVRYEIDAPRGALTHCHCSSCRKHHGAPFASFLEVSAHAFRWLQGERRVAKFSSSPARPRCFCEACGAVAPIFVGDRYLVPAGNLSGELNVAAGRHAFVNSKPAWHTIADALPQYLGAAPGWSSEADRTSAPPVQAAVPGSCLCGDVTFTVTGEPARWLQCHCSRCRRARSAAHGSNTFYPLPQFSWLTGRENLRSYSPPDAKRFATSFCKRCGGGAPVERDNVPFVLVPAALFDSDPGARPQAHIHMASKSSWYSVADGLPQFAELPK
jgi:hypothetical protein